MRRRPLVTAMQSVTFPEAMSKGLIMERKRPEEIEQIIHDSPKANLYGLRFPEKDAKTDRDYMRLSFKEEDEDFLVQQQLKTLTKKEQKRLPREILTDTWEEDLSMYKNKRRP